NLFTIDVVKELPLNHFVIKLPGKICSPGSAVGIANTAGSNAKVSGVDNNANVFRFKCTLNFICNLDGKPLLYLRPLGIILHNPVDLGKADYLTGGKVCNVCRTNDRNKVMLAV